MFKIRDLMVHTLPPAAGRLGGGIVCYWPSNDCCGAFWSNPGGGGPGNIGTSRWLTHEIELLPCFARTLLPGGGGCGLNFSTCPDGSVFTLRAHITAVVNPAELQLLRNELDAAVDLAKQRMGDLEKELTPQSLEDVNRLEEQLKGALDELKARKRELGGK